MAELTLTLRVHRPWYWRPLMALTLAGFRVRYLLTKRSPTPWEVECACRWFSDRVRITVDPA